MDTLNFTLTPEQVQMRRSVRDFVTARSPLSVARTHLDATVDRKDRTLWRALHDQFGAPGILVPEKFGGLGLALDDLAAVLAEMGATLFAGPYWATVALATPILLDARPGDVRDGVLRAIADGTASAAVAFLTADGTSPSRAVQATKTGGLWYLTGRASLVLDVDVADFVLVVAHSLEGLQIFVVDANEDPLPLRSASSIDPTRPLFDIDFDKTTAVPLPLTLGAEIVLARALDHARVALAAEQVGGARACLDRTVEFVKQRTQFDRPIGAFQAVQHHCADALIDIEGAESAVFYAAWAHRDGSAEFTIAAAVAKIAASDAYMRAAADYVHFSGTMGYTREYDAQLYYRRAKWSSLFLGSASQHRGRLADLIGV